MPRNNSIFVNIQYSFDMKIRLLILSICALILSGCVSSYMTLSTTNFELGKVTRLNNFLVFQSTEHFALAAETKLVASPLIVAIRTSKYYEPFYDGKVIRGRFVMVDTYTYETVPDDNGRTRMKTIPLLVPFEEYNGL